MNSSKQSGQRLLLVDDEPIVLNTLAEGLSALGYNVTTCESPADALEKYRHDTPDLVVTDYRMPEMDGLCLAKAMIEFTHRPIIIPKQKIHRRRKKMSIRVSLRGMLRLIRVDTLRRVYNVGFLAGRLL